MSIGKVKKILLFLLKRRILFLLGFILLWETAYLLNLFPPLLFPSTREIFSALIKGIMHEALLHKAARSVSLIFQGLSIGICVSLVLLGLSLTNKLYKNIIENLTTYLNPIPGMAIFPLVILWFGLGRSAIIVVIIHSVLWGLLVNLIAGVSSIPSNQKEIGQNLELSKLRMLTDIYIPACMPFIVAGTKAALARAWRSAISVEIIAGVVAGNQGLGWLMTVQRSMINIPGLYSTIIIIMVVGIFFEDVVFRIIENVTVKEWGMAK